MKDLSNYVRALFEESEHRFVRYFLGWSTKEEAAAVEADFLLVEENPLPRIAEILVLEYSNDTLREPERIAFETLLTRSDAYAIEALDLEIAYREVVAKFSNNIEDRRQEAP